MTPGPRLKFKRAALRELVIVLVLGMFGLGALAFTIGALDVWLANRGVHAHERATAGLTRGRVRLSGAATRKTLVRSPAGAEGVGWIAAVGYTARSKNRTWFQPICARGDASDVDVLGGGGTFRLTFARPTDVVKLAQTTGVQESDAPQLDFGTVAPPVSGPDIPQSMRDSCASELSQTKETPLLYREAVLFSGREVDVLGCTPDGVALVPCKDRLDLVSVTPLAQRLEQQRSSDGVGLVFGGVWNLIVVGAAAAMLSSRLVKARLSVEEAAKREASR